MESEAQTLQIAKTALMQAKLSLDALLQDQTTLHAIVRAGEALAQHLKAGGRVYSCGNGGSMCDAMHFAEELTGRFRKDRPAIAAQAISDAGHLSCVGNDLGFDQVFSRFVEAHGRKGDVLLAISTSGKSENVLKAVEVAKKTGMLVIGLSGNAQSRLADEADIAINTPGKSGFADRAQELHIKVIHILIEIIERELFLS